MPTDSGLRDNAPDVELEAVLPLVSGAPVAVARAVLGQLAGPDDPLLDDPELIASLAARLR